MRYYAMRDNVRDGERYRTDNRFRDDRGREHYDNGRFAPMRSQYPEPWTYERQGETYAGGYEHGGGQARSGRGYVDIGWDYPSRQYRGELNEDGMRRIYGFAPDYEAEYRGPSREPEMEHRRGEMHRGYSQSEAVPPLTRDVAERWMQGLKNEDGTTGPHWTMEQVQQLAQQRGINADPLRLWVAMNAEYSDRTMVYRKYGLDRPEVYLDAAVAAWLNDRDAVPNKEAAYWHYVARH